MCIHFVCVFENVYFMYPYSCFHACLHTCFTVHTASTSSKIHSLVYVCMNILYVRMCIYSRTLTNAAGCLHLILEPENWKAVL